MPAPPAFSDRRPPRAAPLLLGLFVCLLASSSAQPQATPSAADLAQMKALSQKLEALGGKIEACGGDVGCVTKLQAEIAAAAAEVSKSTSTMPLGTGWGAYAKHRPCSVVAPPWCCLPVATTLTGTTEERHEEQPTNPRTIPYYPGYTSHFTLFSWRGEGTGELFYQRDFSEFRLISFGTPAQTEVLNMTGYVQSRDMHGRLEKRIVPNQPVKPRNPYELGLVYPSDDASAGEVGEVKTNLFVRPAEVESADDWMPTYSGSNLTPNSPIGEPFLVTPTMMKGFVDSGVLRRSFHWRQELDVGRPPPASFEDNRLDLDLAFGRFRDRRDEEKRDRYCPDVYLDKAAYAIEQDAHAGTLTITMRIRLRRKVVVPQHFVEALRGPRGTIELYVTDVTAGGKPDEERAVSMPELKRLREQWERVIETKWNDRFEIDCGCLERPLRVVFDVQFVDTGGHQVVYVLPGDGRSDSGNWYAGDPVGVAAHEFGHLLGVSDEYADADCPGRPASRDGSIMKDWQGVPKARHFQPFARWLSDGGQKDCRVRPYGGSR